MLDAAMIAHLTPAATAQFRAGWLQRYRTEDHNKVIRDAHRILPGFTWRFKMNLQGMDADKSFQLAMSDAYGIDQFATKPKPVLRRR